jgi:hypothetical protein
LAHHGDGWAALAPAPVVPAAAALHDHRPGPVLAGVTVLALLLVGSAAAIAATARTSEVPARSDAAPSATRTPPVPREAPGGVAARLAFGGVVVEEHAVGITAGYPELELASEDGRTVAHLRLPTANCLATSAPVPPDDPRCRGSRTEYADLAAPDLRVVRDGDVLRISGSFATCLRTPGRPQECTGRSYEVAVTVRAAGTAASGWLPAEGELLWGDQHARTRADGGSNVLRLGD